LKIDRAPGFRVYFGIDEDNVVVLCGGNKSTQRADIVKAKSGGQPTMPKRTHNFREQLLQDLQDHREAARYLNAAAEDSEEMFLVALRDVAEAHRMVTVAAEAGVAREALYRMLSEEGNPRLRNLWAILNAVGLRLRLCL